MTQKAPIDIDGLIRRTDRLIGEAIKVDPVAAILLGLVRTELNATKAAREGMIIRLPTRTN